MTLLYPIPRADSVPDELREIVIINFLIDELTSIQYNRSYEVSDLGDEQGTECGLVCYMQIPW